MLPVNLSINIGGVNQTVTSDQPLRDHQKILQEIGNYLVALFPADISRNETRELAELMHFLYQRAMSQEVNFDNNVKNLINDGLIKSGRLREIMPLEINNVRKEPMSEEAIALVVRLTEIIVQLSRLLSIPDRTI
jgi:hypothetical protein